MSCPNTIRSPPYPTGIIDGFTQQVAKIGEPDVEVGRGLVVGEGLVAVGTMIIDVGVIVG